MTAPVSCTSTPALQAAGEIVDPRAAQVERLKAEVDLLKQRVAARDGQIEGLTEFKTLAISRLAAQHEEIERLRRHLTQVGGVRSLPPATGSTPRRPPG